MLLQVSSELRIVAGAHRRMAEHVKFWRSRPERLDDELQPESPKKRQRRAFADPPVVTTGNTFKSLLNKVSAVWSRSWSTVCLDIFL